MNAALGLSIFAMPNEAALIRWIQDRAGVHSRNVLISIGDDCSVLSLGPEEDFVVTMDLLAESVHFQRAWCSPYCLGRKSLAVNLSDLASMGSPPLACLLGLSLPRTLPESYFEEFMRGFLEESERWCCPLVGGDLSASDSVHVAVTAVGRGQKGESVLRSGGKAGDSLFVVGRLGLARKGLEMLQTEEFRGVQKVVSEGELRLVAGDPSRFDCLKAHLLPEPLVEIGVWLRQNGLANSMIDVSDGLSTDAFHISECSGVSVVLEWSLLESFRPSDIPVEWILDGGEDYALLFSCSTGQLERIALDYPGGFPRPVRVGELVAGPAGLFLRRGDSFEEYEPKGYDHFR